MGFCENIFWYEMKPLRAGRKTAARPARLHHCRLCTLRSVEDVQPHRLMCPRPIASSRKQSTSSHIHPRMQVSAF